MMFYRVATDVTVGRQMRTNFNGMVGRLMATDRNGWLCLDLPGQPSGVWFHPSSVVAVSREDAINT